MESMLSEKGRKLVVLTGYKFYKDRETSEGWKWRCTNRKCTAKVYLDENATVILKSDLHHNHDVSKNLHRERISNSVKRKAMDDLTERPQKLIRKEVSSAFSENINIRDIQYIRKNICRARRAVLPSLPRNAKEVHSALSSIEIKSFEGEEMLQINSEATGIVCLSTVSNMRILCESEVIFIDGTFTYCPKFFTQLFTIHINENGHYIPLVHFLLPKKTSSTYEEMFRMFNKRCEDLGFILHPKSFVIDFEEGIHIAVQNVWPACCIIGCRFHLTQCWWRKIQKLGLTTEYKDQNSEIGKWLHWSFGLTFLSHEEVSDCFVEDLMSVVPRDERLQKYVDYLTENYIAEEAKFPPFIWASDSLKEDRTTNGCESFHARFNANFSAPHPNIFMFLEVIKQFQVDVYALKNSRQIKKKVTNVNFRKRKENMKRMQEKYKNKEVTRFEYLKTISYYSSKKDGNKQDKQASSN